MTPTDRKVLHLAAHTWHSRGALEQACRDELGMSSAQYHFALAGLLSDVGALAESPVLVSRLRRVRDARLVQRSPASRLRVS